MNELHVHLRPGSGDRATALAASINQWAGRDAATAEYDDDVHRLDPGTVTVVVLLVAIGTELIARTLDWLRERSACLVVIDISTTPISIVERCDVHAMRGKTVIVSGDGRLRIDRPITVVDLDRLVQQVIAAGVDRGLQVLRDGGGSGDLLRNDELMP